jgi:hypothetical protein
MGVFAYESVYIGLPAMYHSVAPGPWGSHNTDGFHLIKAITSRDLKTWSWLVSQRSSFYLVLDVSKSGHVDTVIYYLPCLWIQGNRSTFITPSKVDSGAYDLMQMLPPSNVLARARPSPVKYLRPW